MVRDFNGVTGVAEFDEALDTFNQLAPKTAHLFEYLRQNFNKDEDIKRFVIAAQVELVSPLLNL